MPRLLIADADPERRAALVHALADDHEIAEVVHGHAALAALVEGAFDAALLAQHLPLAGAEAIARALTARGTTLPLVVVGVDGPSLTDTLRLAPVVAVLATPVTASGLRRAVAVALAATRPDRRRD